MHGRCVQFFPQIVVGVGHDYPTPHRHEYRCTDCGFVYMRSRDSVNTDVAMCHICSSRLTHAPVPTSLLTNTPHNAKFQR